MDGFREDEMRKYCAVLACALMGALGGPLAPIAHAADFSQISSKDAVSALRTTLDKGAEAAMANLGKPDGFLNNPQARIPLPAPLEKAKGGLKMLGMGDQLGALEVSMNRAAEAAVPQAKTLLKKAIQNMSVADAKSVLSGGDTAVTDFFRRQTETDLTALFLPIVKSKTAEVGAARQYQALADKAAATGLFKPEDLNLEQHVTKKAMDALFQGIAAQEQAIRANPAATGAAILKKVFQQ